MKDGEIPPGGTEQNGLEWASGLLQHRYSNPLDFRDVLLTRPATHQRDALGYEKRSSLRSRAQVRLAANPRKLGHGGDTPPACMAHSPPTGLVGV